MEQRGICKNAVEAALGQLHRQEILMKNLALRMRARHGHELQRSVEPHGFVPQGSEVTQIPAGSTTNIKDGIRRVRQDREPVVVFPKLGEIPPE